MQLVAHRRATDDQRQGQHDLDLVLLDALDHAVGGVTDQAAEHHAADGFAGEQDGGVGDTGRFAQLNDAQQHGEHHYRSAVIEQRFADDRGFQWFRCIRGTQGAEHGDRIGGGDQRAEQQAVDQRDVPAEQGEHPV
ncbi:hypothetical protein D3C71_1699020 [compost metagenome]